jgi:hypothetical protein
VNPSSDQFDEYKLPGDEPEKKIKMSSEKPDTSEYMMKPGRKLVRDLHEYYSEGGYQYGKRKKKK